MKVFQNDNYLIIKENPGCLWLFGLFFAVFGALFIYGALNGFVLFGVQSLWSVNLTFLLGLSGIATGLLVIYKTPVNNIEIEKNENQVRLIRWGLFGKQINTYHFDEINRFCLIENQKRSANNTWDFGLELTTGEKIPITSLGGYTEDYENKYVYPINVFIGKELPVCQLNFELQDESNDEMS